MLYGGKRYEPFEDLENDAFDLISGVCSITVRVDILLRTCYHQLLRPSPSHRYGSRELRCHEYFLNKDTGRSEFFRIEARGLGQYNFLTAGYLTYSNLFSSQHLTLQK